MTTAIELLAAKTGSVCRTADSQLWEKTGPAMPKVESIDLYIIQLGAEPRTQPSISGLGAQTWSNRYAGRVINVIYLFQLQPVILSELEVLALGGNL